MKRKAGADPAGESKLRVPHRAPPALRIATILVPLLLLAGAPFAAEVAVAAPDAAFREILDAAWAEDEPGAAALVARGDEVLFLGARGIADMELGVPLRPDMVFRLGSITKQFTATGIMMLAEEGKLSLDDPLTRFLPDYPEVGKRVTVEHLLTHTSGIVSYTGIPGYMESESKVARDLDVDELIAVFRDLPAEFEPGARHAYNNSGYVLLGAIIERVSGLGYAEFVRSRIFEPLGMTRSYYGSHNAIIPGRVSGYGGAPGGYRNARYLSMTQAYSAGALLSTVEDLWRWTTALFGGELIGAESIERITTPYVLEDGSPTTYGYGLVIGDIRGRRAIGHGGGIFGFATYAVYVPEAELFVAVFSNDTGSDANPGTVANRLAALALNDPYPAHRRVEVPTDLLRGYTGIYRIEGRAERAVTLEDGRLYTQRAGGPKLEALPASATTFFYKASLNWFEMTRDDDGKLRMLMHQQGAETAEEAVRVGDAPEPRIAVAVDPAVLERYVGRYEIVPGFDITVRRDGARLFGRATGQAEFELFAESRTEFFLKVVDAQVTFVVADDRPAASLVLHQGGRDLPGKRID